MNDINIEGMSSHDYFSELVIYGDNVNTKKKLILLREIWETYNRMLKTLNNFKDKDIGTIAEIPGVHLINKIGIDYNSRKGVVLDIVPISNYQTIERYDGYGIIPDLLKDCDDTDWLVAAKMIEEKETYVYSYNLHGFYVPIKKELRNGII